MATPAKSKQQQQQSRQTSEEEKARNKVYYQTRAALIENHREEYNRLLQENAAAAGVTLQIRKTASERAAEKIAKLLEEHPELASQFGAKPVDQDTRLDGLPTADDPDPQG